MQLRDLLSTSIYCMIADNVSKSVRFKSLNKLEQNAYNNFFNLWNFQSYFMQINRINIHINIL